MRVSRQISTAELSAANTPEKGYVAIRGEVYDLTKFMERHPGGWNIILAAVGFVLCCPWRASGGRDLRVSRELAEHFGRKHCLFRWMSSSRSPKTP